MCVCVLCVSLFTYLYVHTLKKKKNIDGNPRHVVNLEDGGEVFLTSLPKTIHILYSTRIFTLNQHRINASRTGGSEKKFIVLHPIRERERNVLFNDALNTFYLRLYGVRHMVKDHSDSEKGNPLPPHRLLFPINSKGSFICTIPQTG